MAVYMVGYDIVHTQQIEKIADITADDGKAVDAGMTKCSA
jgi:hypothetical protein